MIIAVASALGAGKTHWICQQIAKNNNSVGYFSPQTDSVPIDGTYLQSEYPHLTIYQTGEEGKLLVETDRAIGYIEIPWYIDLAGVESLLQTLNAHRVALIPPDVDNAELKAWADEVLIVRDRETGKIETETESSPRENTLWSISNTHPKTSLQIHRGILTGQILDFDSLATFWLELTQGAYGEVVRAKGIFDLEDGHLYYGNFTPTQSKLEFHPLNFPRWEKGRPERFSGFEIIGNNLNKAEISQTIKDCFVPESAIHYYQQQIQEFLESEQEVEVV
ncbi:GTP-binding protein [Lusitaniella coriacea]|uniref:GTP-binding protein n=1 Tax=Lusitaniella coriacea TaxID=1983105 RepID=UPI003CF5C0F0